MKKIMTVIAIGCVLCVCGCSYNGAKTNNGQTQNPVLAPMSAFQDEQYVWENWRYSTNKVEGAIVK